MKYYQVYVQNVRDIYTWESTEDISIGSRVVIAFRGRKKIGIVVGFETKKPDFKTQPILEWIHDFTIPESAINQAQSIAKQTFSYVGKVLSLMIPNEFLLKKNPEKRTIFYTKNKTDILVTGEKQKAVLTCFDEKESIDESDLLVIAAKATLTGLVNKDVLKKDSGGIVPAFADIQPRPSHTLNKEQQFVLEELEQSAKPHLLWGVTGSGKTEVYKEYVKKVLKEKGGQVLILVPEISLTPQLIAEFASLSERPLSVWHSKLSKGEKIQEWARIVTGESEVIVGTRSSVVLPFKNLKCVIVDEEHEWTYKNDFSPRFWVHDVVEARSKDIKLIFGSATPRLESFAKVHDGSWDMCELRNRVGGGELPEINIIDLRNEAKKGNYTALSETLVKDMDRTIKEGKQVVLFLNKRGYAGSTQCKDCGEVFECPNCSYALKLHGQGERARLICHVCGHMKALPRECPTCKTDNFVFKGWGTQQVEELLNKEYPHWRVIRADKDTMTGKNDHTNMLETFHNHEADILLGTQMISKGLDFEKVALVGILLADVGLHLPDFRAEERVFQLLLQVAGRAGRRDTRGEIILQTFNEANPLFKAVQRYDVRAFYEQLENQRKQVGFPPFGTVAKITFSDPDKMVGYEQSKKLIRWFDQVKGAIDVEITMAPAFFPRSHNKYHWHVFVRSTKKDVVVDLITKTPEELLGKIDLNPVSLL